MLRNSHPSGWLFAYPIGVMQAEGMRDEPNLCIEEPVRCLSGLNAQFDWTDWLELLWLVGQIATKMIGVI